MPIQAHPTGDEQTELADIDQLIGWMTGFEPSAIAKADTMQTRAHLKQIEMLLKRERNKGVARHWAYDFSRHITLKRARDRLIGLLESKSARSPGTRPAKVAPPEPIARSTKQSDREALRFNET